MSTTCELAIEIGEADPKKMATRFFGRSRVVSPALELSESSKGFVLSQQGIPMRAVVFFLAAFSLLIGIIVWNVSKDFAAFLSSFAVVALAAGALLYTCDDQVKGTGPMVSFDADEGRVRVDSTEEFDAKQIVCLYDARGWNPRKSGGYRQASALIQKGDRRFLCRLFHQCNDGYIEDHLVDSIATRLNVPCHVLEDVLFEGI